MYSTPVTYYVILFAQWTLPPRTVVQLSTLVAISRCIAGEQWKVKFVHKFYSVGAGFQNVVKSNGTRYSMFVSLDGCTVQYSVIRTIEKCYASSPTHCSLRNIVTTVHVQCIKVLFVFSRYVSTPQARWRDSCTCLRPFSAPFLLAH